MSPWFFTKKDFFSQYCNNSDRLYIYGFVSLMHLGIWCTVTYCCYQWTKSAQQAKQGALYKWSKVIHDTQSARGGHIVFMVTYIHTYIHIYTYIYIYIYIFLYIYIYIYIYVCVCVCICTHVYLHRERFQFYKVIIL